MGGFCSWFLVAGCQWLVALPGLCNFHHLFQLWVDKFGVWGQFAGNYFLGVWLLGVVVTLLLTMNRSVLIAVSIFLALALYMASGVFRSGVVEEPTVIPAVGGRQIMTVTVAEREASEIAREVLAPGRTRAAREVVIKAETAGRVIEVPNLRGRIVAPGDLLVGLEPESRPERLLRSEAIFEQRRLEYESAQRLRSQDLQAASQLAAARAAFEEARERLRQDYLELKKTEIRAPFAGRLQERYVESGDFVSIGDPLAFVVETDPLIVVGEVTELQIALVHIGEKAVARLMGGQLMEGHLRYVAPQADPQTRTYRVELEVPNPDGKFPLGATAQIAIETERVYAHRISPALISIADDGRFGVKYVDEDNRVRFAEADIVQSSPEFLWLGGLPQRLRLITLGQGFTLSGDLVQVIEDENVTW
jgi:multidrug efflux system membrane fusion protein